ncbi:hypothetical protein KDM41_04120 [bacterium]|nr:hypothetical protein [bacterium]
MTRLLRTSLATAALLGAWIVCLGGCGEKIALPVPEGQFGIYDYLYKDEFAPAGEIRQLKYGIGGLYILEPGRLVRYNNDFEELQTYEGLGDATAICFYDQKFLVFVWDGASSTLSWHNAASLELEGSVNLAEVTAVADMATNAAGLEQAPWAETFLYLSDPAAEVVHRYTFDELNGLLTFGYLTTNSGDGARFAHAPAGLLSDAEGRMLVCDQDSLRNWVIRFDATPDETDVTPDPNDQDPLRGLTYPFRDSGCINPPAGDFVLGSAPTACTGDGGWVGGPSSLAGEFDRPSALTRDGQGRLFAVDRGNDRFQVFGYSGDDGDWLYEFQFGSDETLPDPVSIGLFDVTSESPPFYAAYVFVHLGESNRVIKLISTEYQAKLDEDVPPEDLP